MQERSLRSQIEDWIKRDPIHYRYLLSFFDEGAKLIDINDESILLYKDDCRVAYGAGKNIKMDPGYLIMVDNLEEAQRIMDLDIANDKALKVYMAYYPKDEIEIEDVEGITFRDITMDDYDYVKKYYDGPSASHPRAIETCIENGMIGAEDENGLCGFIGKHLEGAIGYLFVEESHRHRGIAQHLEKCYIKKQLDAGFLPYCHVIETNEASLSLQKKTGLEIYPELFYWIAGKDYE